MGWVFSYGRGTPARGCGRLPGSAAPAGHREFCVAFLLPNVSLLKLSVAFLIRNAALLKLYAAFLTNRKR